MHIAKKKKWTGHSLSITFAYTQLYFFPYCSDEVTNLFSGLGDLGNLDNLAVR